MSSLDSKSLAAHLIVALARAQTKGRVVRLDELASELEVRRADVRHVVTRLHAEGHVDALRLRLSMTGLALAAALGASALPRLGTIREARREGEALARARPAA